jgi:hypothetical protein
MEFARYIPLNFALMRNPFNWVIVTLMVMIAGLALNLIFPADMAGTTPPATED